MTTAFIGLDLGTTSIKAVAFDADGSIDAPILAALIPASGYLAA